MSNFLIVGTQRSGTTLLRSALDNHPDIRCLGEVFYINPEYGKQGGAAMGRGLDSKFSSWRQHSYQSYISRTVINRIGHWLFRRRVTHKYLDEMFSHCASSACGFKLMANQLRRFPAVLDYISENKVHVIHMQRQNPMDIYLSRLSLEARGYAHSSVDVKQDIKIDIPLDSLLTELEKIESESQRWRELLQDRAPYLKVTYEEFVGERSATSARILDFIGVDATQELESELKKLNTKDVSELVANFKEVRSVLSGSEYEWCIR